MTIQTYSVGTSVGNAYVSSGNSAITFMSICNYSGSTVTANVYVVPNTSIATTTNLVYQNLQLTPGDTYQLYYGGEKLILGPGDSVQINASQSSAITTVTSYTSI